MTISDNTVQTFRVGGFVRDSLLGITPKDVDFVVVGSTPEQMLAQSFRQVGRDFPVFLDENGNEHALARTERKSGTGHSGFEVFASPDVTLEEDLERRDLTINAMAMDTDGNVIDPFGGQNDLQAGVIRHVGPAFQDDPLRVLRVARFAARFGFTIAPETMALMHQMVKSGEVDSLTPERVMLELTKALGTKTPSAFFLTLRECGALARVMPEIDNLFGVPQPAAHHAEGCAGTHTMMVVDMAAKLTSDLATRFASLTHDLGKAITDEALLPSHHGHEAAGVSLVHTLCDRLSAPSDFRWLATRVAEFHTKAHKALEMRPGKIVRLFEALDAFRRPDNLASFLLAVEADARGRQGKEEADYPQSLFLNSAFEACREVQGRDIAQAGFTGSDIAVELRQRRIRKVLKVAIPT